MTSIKLVDDYKNGDGEHPEYPINIQLQKNGDLYDMVCGMPVPYLDLHVSAADIPTQLHRLAKEFYRHHRVQGHVPQKEIDRIKKMLV